MYSACVCYPYETPDHKTALKHMRFTLKSILTDLECTNGWTVAAYLQVAFVALDMKNKRECSCIMALAVSLAQYLKMHLDELPPYPSVRTGKEIMDAKLAKNVARASWFVLFTWDLNSMFMFSQQIQISSQIDQMVIDDFQSPNLGDPSNIQDNTLALYYHIIPLLNFGRRIIQLNDMDAGLGPEQTRDFLIEMETWFSNLPLECRFKQQDGIWLGRSINYLNEIHHFLRLKLLKRRFLSALVEEKNIWNPFLQKVVDIASNITQMASSYPLGIVQTHIDAMKLVSATDVITVRKCLEDPWMAIELLETIL
ncbi:hypothetical protein HDU91_007367 [Kappamyces sp. JEL0680]|nr:hypothetical protein HDU91_007367 [Kappamyces sp. JEL0680]